MELPELFGELRSLLSQPPEEGLWWRIEHALGRFEDDELLEQVVAPYLLEQFAHSWPHTLERRARMEWYGDDQTPARKRALGSLATVCCPSCQKACAPAEVMQALKHHHGKRFSKLVRFRDVITGTRRERRLWVCDTCQDDTVAHAPHLEPAPRKKRRRHEKNRPFDPSSMDTNEI
jgi:hypothetical protein